MTKVPKENDETETEIELSDRMLILAEKLRQGRSVHTVDELIAQLVHEEYERQHGPSPRVL